MIKDLAEASRQRFRQLAQVEFDPAEFLPAAADPGEIQELIKAAGIVDEIFWRQASPLDAARLLALAGDDRELREMVQFHYGPYDRLESDRPFFRLTPSLQERHSIPAT